MELKRGTIEELVKIIKKDYGVLITAEQANKLGASLLRLTRLAGAALARVSRRGDLNEIQQKNS